MQGGHQKRQHPETSFSSPSPLPPSPLAIVNCPERLKFSTGNSKPTRGFGTIRLIYNSYSFVVDIWGGVHFEEFSAEVLGALGVELVQTDCHHHLRLLNTQHQRHTSLGCAAHWATGGSYAAVNIHEFYIIISWELSLETMFTRNARSFLLQK